MARYDLLLQRGTVIDPASGLNEKLSIAIKNGKIAAVDKTLDPSLAHECFDASGKYVTPGLIDLHAHVHELATASGIHADAVAWRTGVTTWVDAGSTGAPALAGLLEHTVPRNRSRILAFINISCVAGMAEGWDLSEDAYSDVSLCTAAARTAPGFVVGVKARIDRDRLGTLGLEPLRRAREAADELDLPLMVHISHGPPSSDDVLPFLGRGDILTHSFTGLSMNVLHDGRPTDALIAARERGVALDLGHGMGSLSFSVTETLLEHGIAPDTISTDAYAAPVRGAMVDLPTCMSKFLALGMTLEDVVRASTATPASLIGRPDLGTLTVGGPADLAVFSLLEGDFDYYDSFHERRRGNCRLRNELTLRRGVRMTPKLTLTPRLERTPAWARAEAMLERTLRDGAYLPEHLLPEGFGPPEPRR